MSNKDASMIGVDPAEDPFENNMYSRSDQTRTKKNERGLHRHSCNQTTRVWSLASVVSGCCSGSSLLTLSASTQYVLG